MEVVDIFFKHLLLKIMQKSSMLKPKYGLTVDTSSQLSAYIDADVQHGDSVTEIVRSWGSPAYVAGPFKQDAARNGINTLHDDLGFNIRDTNFEDVKFYKNLPSHVSEQYNTSMSKYNSLKWDYKLLKECYNKAMDERDCYFAKHFEIQQKLEKIFDIINRPDMVNDALEEGAAHEPSAASE